MSVIKIDLELGVDRYIDVDGNIVVDLYDNNNAATDKPLTCVSFSHFELIKELIDMCVDEDGKVSDLDFAEMLYEIVDELQDCIDYLNDHIADPDEV